LPVFPRQEGERHEHHFMKHEELVLVILRYNNCNDRVDTNPLLAKSILFLREQFVLVNCQVLFGV
jgi:hypothetical protein